MRDLRFEIPGVKVELKRLWLMSSDLRFGSSKTEGGRGPSREFQLKFSVCKWGKYLMSGGIRPERLRPDKLRAVTWFVLRSHLTPVQEHQSGCSRGLENAVVRSQFWKEFEGSIREDFIERRERSWRGGDEAAPLAAMIKIREKKGGIRFMVWVL